MFSNMIVAGQFCLAQVIIFCIPILILQILIELFYRKISEQKISEDFHKLLLVFTLPGCFFYEVFVAMVIVISGGEIKHINPKFDWQNGFCLEKEYSFSSSNFMKRFLGVTIGIVPVLATWLLLALILNLTAGNLLNPLCLSVQPSTYTFTASVDVLLNLPQCVFDLFHGICRTGKLVSLSFIIGSVFSFSILCGVLFRHAGLEKLRKDLKSVTVLFFIGILFSFLFVFVLMLNSTAWQYIHNTLFTIEYSILILMNIFSILFFLFWSIVRLIKKNQIPVNKTLKVKSIRSGIINKPVPQTNSAKDTVG